MKVLKSLYIRQLFFYILLSIAGLFFLSFFFQQLFIFAEIALLLLFVAVITDLIILFFSIKNPVEADRILPDRFSNGDENKINLELSNNFPFKIMLEIIDEIPIQFQIRNFNLKATLSGSQTQHFDYSLRPTERGEYTFGRLNVFINTQLGLISRRLIFSENKTIACYPSFIQLRKYDLLAFSNQISGYGFKKIRRIGHTLEFEQIRDYVAGDDIRTINWKATSKKSSLMVNQYQDEKSQPVYQLIDIGRSMQMPFDGLSLLDYAINSTLALSNIIIKKQDRAGMFTFSKKCANFVVADRKSTQMHRIMEVLYRIDTDFYESDFSRLYVDIKQSVTQRSLLFLYTNFESLDALYRQLPFLIEIARNHLLIVIFFENSELTGLIDKRSDKVKEIYDKAIAEKFRFEKRLIVNELKKYGIQSILTQPENLTIESLSKYLELKARGMI